MTTKPMSTLSTLATLFSEQELAARVSELGGKITEDYSGLVSEENPLLLVGVLKGAVVFLSDLMRRIKLPCQLDFVQLASYNGTDATESTGDVRLLSDVAADVKNRYVLVIEDICDTARTLSKLCALLEARGALSIKTAALLDKPSRRVVNFNANYVGFEIDDLFVVGYGLDCAEKHREVPYVAVIK